WVSDGVLFKKSSTPYRIRLTFASNTLSRLGNCLHFEELPPADDVNHVIVRNNLIIGAHSLIWVDGPTPDDSQIRRFFTDFAGNVTRPGAVYCPKGLFTTQLTRINFPYLVLNQTDDRNFLHYKKSDPLFKAGAHGEPAGAPPVED